VTAPLGPPTGADSRKRIPESSGRWEGEAVHAQFPDSPPLRPASLTEADNRVLLTHFDPHPGGDTAEV